MDQTKTMCTRPKTIWMVQNKFGQTEGQGISTYLVATASIIHKFFTSFVLVFLLWNIGFDTKMFSATKNAHFHIRIRSLTQFSNNLSNLFVGSSSEINAGNFLLVYFSCSNIVWSSGSLGSNFCGLGIKIFWSFYNFFCSRGTIRICKVVRVNN